MYDVDVGFERMHRTQILLDEERYEELRERASLEGKSLGQLVRELIDLGLERRRKKAARRLRDYFGFIEGAEADPDHDEVVYGEE